MKKDRSRERKKSTFERDVKIKKVTSQKEAGKSWKKFLETEDFDD